MCLSDLELDLIDRQSDSAYQICESDLQSDLSRISFPEELVKISQENG